MTAKFEVRLIRPGNAAFRRYEDLILHVFQGSIPRRSTVPELSRSCCFAITASYADLKKVWPALSLLPIYSLFACTGWVMLLEEPIHTHQAVDPSEERTAEKTQISLTCFHNMELLDSVSQDEYADLANVFRLPPTSMRKGRPLQSHRFQSGE